MSNDIVYCRNYSPTICPSSCPKAHLAKCSQEHPDWYIADEYNFMDFVGTAICQREASTIFTEMPFPETVEEFMEQYKVVDTKEIYSNGLELVPIFRMKQWFAHQKEANDER